MLKISLDDLINVEVGEGKIAGWPAELDLETGEPIMIEPRIFNTISLKATILAIPSARKTTMNGNTLPLYVLGIVREKGHPIQLVNAFESSVRPSLNGFAVESINRMNQEYADIKDTWGIESVFAKAVVKKSLKEQASEHFGKIETCSFNDLIEGMVEHVI